VLGWVIGQLAGYLAGRPGNAAAPPPAKEVTAEEQAAKAAQERKKEVERERFVASLAGLKTLQSSMKNPKSFDVEQVLRMADGTLCVTYRATNSFNAVVPGWAVITKAAILTSGHDGFIGRWNARCGGKTGDDVTYMRRALSLL
jgi:hypothetical protein